MSNYQATSLADIFTEAFQEALVGFCILDERFFFQCKDKIKPEWITAAVEVRDIYDQIIKFYNKENRSPLSKEELINSAFFMTQSLGVRTTYWNTMIRCEESTKATFQLDRMKRQLTGFIRTMKMRELVQTSYTMLTKQGVDKAYEWSKNAIGDLKDLSFEDKDNKVDFSDPISWLLKSFERDNNAISTGSADLDRALEGGFFKGEASAIMAASNTGKTTFLITLIRHCIVNHQKVLFITHEGNEDRLKRQILSAVTGLNSRELRGFLLKTGFDPNDYDNKIRISLEEVNKKYLLVCQEVEQAYKLLEENLVFIHHVKTSQMYIENVVDLIKNEHEKAMHRWGRGFDIIVDDYPKKLRSKAAGRNELRRIELGDIYDTFNILAAELKTHCLTALQTNRAAAKANKGIVESDYYLGGEDADESYGIIQNLACVISLNRSLEDTKHNIAHYSIAKARGGPVNQTVTCRTRYDRSLLFGDPNMFETYGKFVNSLSLRGGLASWLKPTNFKIKTDEAALTIKKIEDCTENTIPTK